eukprot:GHRQ01029330.1.p2 GENE.GHRQ01029330.1~~GHRQ01029330.1.p2  ORF type:complete len:107 (+),score=23.00 GHRQ01029330.1:983-1303(+)
MTATDEPQAHQVQQMLRVLQQYWGYNMFREPQDQVILNALAGNDSLVVMATGGGKSICYQVPPLVTGEGGCCVQRQRTVAHAAIAMVETLLDTASLPVAKQMESSS